MKGKENKVEGDKNVVIGHQNEVSGGRNIVVDHIDLTKILPQKRRD